MCFDFGQPANFIWISLFFWNRYVDWAQKASKAVVPNDSEPYAGNFLISSASLLYLAFRCGWTQGIGDGVSMSACCRNILFLVIQ